MMLVHTDPVHRTDAAKMLDMMKEWVSLSGSMEWKSAVKMPTATTATSFPYFTLHV